MTIPAWQDDAACKDAPTAWFFDDELPAKHQEQRDKAALERTIKRLEAAGLPPDTAAQLWRVHQEQHEHYGRARVICGACEVRRECLEYSFAIDAVGGVFGGYDEVQRRAIRRGRRRLTTTDRVAVETELAS